MSKASNASGDGRPTGSTLCGHSLRSNGTACHAGGGVRLLVHGIDMLDNRFILAELAAAAGLLHVNHADHWRETKT